MIKKASELELQNSLISAINEASPEGILVVDDQGVIISHNRRFLEIWQISENSLPDSESGNVIGADAALILSTVIDRVTAPDAFLARIKELYENPDLTDHCEIDLRDGRILERYSSVLRGGKGQYLGRVWFFRDTTASKKTEMALRKGELQLQHAQSIANIGSWDFDLKTKQLIWSDQLYQIYGVAPEIFKPSEENLINLLHPDDRSAMQEWIAACSSGNKPDALRFRSVWPDGTVRFIEGQGELLSDDLGKPAHVFGTAQDITERKKIEDNLLITQFASDHAPDNIMWVDESARIVYVNEATCRNYGYTENELLAKTILDVDPGSNPEKWPDHWKTLQEKGSITFETTHRRKDGHIFPIEVSANSVRFGGRALNVAFIRDITERKQSLEMLRITQFVSDQAPDDIIWVDESAHIVYANEAACREYGYTKEEMLELKVWDINPKATLDNWRNQWQKLKQEKHLHFEAMHKRKDGSVFPIEITANFVDFEGRQLNVAFMRNITERKHQQVLLERNRERFEKVFEYSSDGLFILDMQGNFIDINRTAYESLGYTKAEMMTMKLTELDPPEYAAKVPKRIQQIKEHGMAVFETAHYRKDGSIMPVEVKARVIELGGEKVFLSVVRDITKRKEDEEEIRNLAFYDSLTGLPNRRLLMDRLKHAMASSGRSGRPCAMMFIDLDHFKTLNDTLGHDIGDLLLVEVAKRLEACVREGDTVSRLGGDEFMLILESLSANKVEAGAQTEAIGEKILAVLNEPYSLDVHVCHTSPSIGATVFDDNRATVEELMKQADIAMYQSKKAGRNTLRFFDPQMQSVINELATLEADLRKAVEQNQFQLHYQIQVDSSNRPLGAEALIRWVHPERGLIFPGQFLPLAEETGLMQPIGRWVLDTACAQLKVWQQDPRTRDFVLAVNISPKRFGKSEFVEEIQHALKRHAIDPKLLKLELTEGLLLENIDAAITVMNTLNEIGVQLSLDDFGTGYSSLQYLKRLPLDQLKIDQSFVRDLVEDSSDRAIVRTIIAMAESLELNVIAEGVETVEQRQQLLVMGCKSFQGYYFGKPVPIEQFEAALPKG